MPVELFLERCKKQFDLIFLDPPFPYKFHQKLIETVARRNILTESGMLMIHRPQEKPMPDFIPPLELCDRRTYGRSIVDFYKTQAANQKPNL